MYLTILWSTHKSILLFTRSTYQIACPSSISQRQSQLLTLSIPFRKYTWKTEILPNKTLNTHLLRHLYSQISRMWLPSSLLNTTLINIYTTLRLNFETLQTAFTSLLIELSLIILRTATCTLSNYLYFNKPILKESPSDWNGLSFNEWIFETVPLPYIWTLLQ